ncbi:cyclin b1 interacting protein 1 [Stemphylium lycopersici]|nr:cyclin b1 interacting protein 1 [Stemphylium lycopersici]RAQ98680.1 cyclin b1 interacting protein 1 [Stemphylium lycopersici]
MRAPAIPTFSQIRRIEHAGYHRSILQRNPPRYDPDGDEVEVDDEYEEEDDVEPVEENPYGNIQLESLLAPLTSAADLPNHPALSVAFTSRHLTDLANEAGALSRKEQVTNARAKNLFVKLQGDSTFAPAALAAMSDTPFRPSHSRHSNARLEEGQEQQVHDAEMRETVEGGQDVDMEDAAQPNGTNGDTGSEVNGTHTLTNGTHSGSADEPQVNGEGEHSPMGEDASDTASQQTAHRMTTRTRARAHAASTPSPPQSPSGSNAVHPLFIHPIESLPDRDFGLPSNEAEETRMLLMAYVQKQEEVARITSDLYQGLLQADRMRQDVYKWSKAEGHIGEMSDGEDWYDNEEWGLEQDLAKGRDEEEDETAVAGKKSTRQRRKPDKDDRHSFPKTPVTCFRVNIALSSYLTPPTSSVLRSPRQAWNTTGLSRSTNGHRTCPACGASLHNPDDVVIAGLNPSEDYKTSVLGGLSPTIIMECASRGLAFHSYQTSQEIIYQEHLAKGLTEKYNTLSQQMDQLIHDANAQIKVLQDKMHTMQADQVELESKNHDWEHAFKEKSKAHKKILDLYQALKAQVMASHVANAAGDEAASTLQTARRDRFIDRMPGARTGTANFSQMGMSQQTDRRFHNRNDSRSSGSSGRQQQGGVHVGPPFNPQLHGRSLGSRVHTGLGAPSQSQQNHLPILGGARQNPYLSQDSVPSYQNTPRVRQRMASGVAAQGPANFANGRNPSKRPGNVSNIGSFGR